MTNIYVGNFDFSTSEDELQTLFAAYTAVKTVTAVTDRDTRQPGGFAFVEMTNAGEARDAIRTSAIVSKEWGDDAVGCSCESIRENLRHFQTSWPSETGQSHEY